MSKKIFTTLILIILILSSIVIPIIYAKDTGAISVPNTKLKTGEQAKVYINLENITKYTVSKVILSTDIYLEPILDTANTGIANDDTEFSSKDKEFTINIPEGTTKPICISYMIPTYIASGTKIKLKAIILDSKDKEQEKSSFEINIISDETNKPSDENNTQNNNTSNNANTEKNNNTIANIESNSNTNSKQNVNQTSKAPVVNMGNTITETVTYKGSRNNYLTGITVSGYDLTPIFKKTNNTYFITVPNDVTSVDVSAVKEDSSAVVTVSGNTNLKEGLNKVLISVLAKNGDVRYYRVFLNLE